MDLQHIAELALMGMLNVAASFGAIRARLGALDKRCDDVEEEANRAHMRIDAILLK